MAFIQSDVTTLENQIRASITNGSWRVQQMQFSDQVMTLRSLEDAQKLLAWMRQEVSTASSRSRTRYASVDKGI